MTALQLVANSWISTCSRRAMTTVATIEAGNSPCSTTPTVAESRAASTSGSSNSPVKSAMTPPSGLNGTSRSRTVPSRRSVAPRPYFEQLERDGRRQPLDELVGGDDHDEAVRRRRHRLLARVSRSAALDEPPVRRDLVAPSMAMSSREEPRHRRTARRACRALARRARSPATWRRTAARDCALRVPEAERDRRAGSEPDEHPVLDQLRRRLGGDLLLPVDAHENDNL